MAIRMRHRVVAQEIRFPNQPAAERYADHFGGGLTHWEITIAGAESDTPPPGPRPEQL